MDINRITISSKDNLDWNGTWTKDDARRLMNEIGIDPFNDFEYVFEMVLDNECPDEVVEMFVNTPEIKSIELVLPSGTVKIQKF